MNKFHGSNGNGFGDIWWTDKLIYFSNYINCPNISVSSPLNFVSASGVRNELINILSHEHSTQSYFTQFPGH